MKLTTTGTSVAVTSVLLVMVGSRLGYEAIALLGVSGVVLLFVAAFSVARRPHVDIVRQVDPTRVTVGESAHGALITTNGSRRTSPPLVAEEQFGGERLTIPMPSIEPGRTVTTPYRLPTGRRGVIEIGPLTVRKTDPFGLATNLLRLTATDTLWVHPRYHAVTTMPSGRSRDLEGPTSDTAPEGGMAFHALREYVRGDDLRQIHWRSTARTGTLMVRHMVDASLPVTTIILDSNEDRFTDDDFEHAVEAAASLAVSSMRERFPVRLLTTGAHPRDLVQLAGNDVLDELAGIRLEDGSSLARVAPRLTKGSGGGALVLLLGRPSDEDASWVARLRKSFDPSLAVRFHDNIGLDSLSEANGRLPGTVTIDASSVDEFLEGWARAVLRQ